MFKLICLFLFLSLSFSSRVLGTVGSALTIYNGGQSHVKDVRQVLFNRPKSTIYFSNVASTIQQDSILIIPRNGGVRIQDITYNNGTQQQDKLATLKNYINKTISFKTNDGLAHLGKLIAFSYTFIKIINPKTGLLQLYDNFHSLKLPPLGSNKILSPTIIFTAAVRSTISTPVEASYQASGLSWKTSYVLYVYPNETRGNLSGFANIENKSGRNFTNTQLNLIAGDVNIVSNYYREIDRFGYQQSEVMTGSVGFWNQREISSNQPISDYQMYTVSQKVSLPDGSNKQVQLFNTVDNVAISKLYTAKVYSVASKVEGPYASSNQDVKFSNQFTIRNTKANGLGRPLPEGNVRVFKRDSRGATQFIGQGSTGHVPQGENITFKTGSPFDLKAQYIVRNKTKFPNSQQFIYSPNGQSRQLYSAKLQLKVKNSAFTPAPIELTLDSPKQVKISYEAGYAGPRWQRIGERQYKIKTTVPSNSTGSVYWNELSK